MNEKFNKKWISIKEKGKNKEKGNKSSDKFMQWNEKSQPLLWQQQQQHEIAKISTKKENSLKKQNISIHPLIMPECVANKFSFL